MHCGYNCFWALTYDKKLPRLFNVLVELEVELEAVVDDVAAAAANDPPLPFLLLGDASGSNPKGHSSEFN
jgi:hypothetical protein